MNVRFYVDVDTGLPHFGQHGVTEAEVLRVLDTPIENRRGSGDSRILMGRASGGRFIRVVASFDDDGEGVFVITAFEVAPAHEAARAIMKSRKKQKASAPPKRRKDPNQYPKGWNRKRVEAIIDHYEKQTDDEAIAEDEAAYHSATVTMMAVPVELVPQVQKLIAKRAG